MASPSSVCEVVSFLLLGSLAVVYSQGGCIDCNRAGTVSCSGSQCVCLPGVTGTLCDQCAPGYSGLSSQGCRSDCGCSSVGSIGPACSDGACQCRSRAAGDKCDMCAVGYHFFTRGCVSCPPCFNGVPQLYSTALDLYLLLEAQLNLTIEGGTVGVSPRLLDMLMEYERQLEELYRRVNAALRREQVLTVEEERLSNLASPLRIRVEQFQDAVQSVERDIAAAIQSANTSHRTYDHLVVLVDALRTDELQLLRILTEEAQSLNEQLFARLQRLEEIAVSANVTSFEREQEALSLYNQLLAALSDIRSSIQLLVEIASQQNSSLIVLSNIEVLLPNLEDLSLAVRNRLANISIEVPGTLQEASRSLEEVLNLSPLELDLNSTQDNLEMVQQETQETKASAAVVTTTLRDYSEEFIRLNQTLSSLVEESRALDERAEFLLERARRYLNLGQYSRDQANDIIKEAESLLRDLRNGTHDQDRLVEGLNSVIMNVERAERTAISVTNEVRTASINLNTLETSIGTAVSTLERASGNLQEALNLTTSLNISALYLVRNSSILSEDAEDLSDEVTTLLRAVLDLQRMAREDSDVISDAATTANKTIDLSRSVHQRIQMASVILMNLTVELNRTVLLPPGRLSQVLSVLEPLEATANLNQIKVNSLIEQMLTDLYYCKLNSDLYADLYISKNIGFSSHHDKVRLLQESADALNRSFTELRQHRDLLQRMLNNVMNLDCMNQFQ